MRNVSSRKLLMVFGLIAGAMGVVVMLVVPTPASSVTVIGAVLVIVGWTLLGILAIRNRRPGLELRQLREELKAHEERQLDRTRRIVSVIEAERAKESRHEYLQERALERIESRIRETAVTAEARKLDGPQKRSPDVLFVTSNGAGLGHLTRLLAVADHLGPSRDIEFLTLSRAYKQVASMGYLIRYFPSAETAGVTTRVWNSRFRMYLQEQFALSIPKIVVFDGTVVYEGLVDVCRGHGTPLVWMQRGFWKPEAEARYPIRLTPGQVADRVIVPGDFAGDEVISSRDSVKVSQVGPIVLLSRDRLLTEAEAKRELCLSPRTVNILFNLGGGLIADGTPPMNALRSAVRDSGIAAQITVAESPLSGPVDYPDDIKMVQRYPLMRYVRAFDFVVSAAGYNSVQEAAALQVPTIFVPNLRTQTDDQDRRATLAARQGWALVARTPDELAEAARELIEKPAAIDDLKNALLQIVEPTGARDAAEIVQEEISGAAWHQARDIIAAREPQ